MMIWKWISNKYEFESIEWIKLARDRIQWMVLRNVGYVGLLVDIVMELGAMVEDVDGLLAQWSGL